MEVGKRSTQSKCFDEHKQCWMRVCLCVCSLHGVHGMCASVQAFRFACMCFVSSIYISMLCLRKWNGWYLSRLSQAVQLNDVIWNCSIARTLFNSCAQEWMCDSPLHISKQADSLRSVHYLTHWAIYGELHERLLYKRVCSKCLNTRTRELHHCATVNDAVSIARAQIYIKTHSKRHCIPFSTAPCQMFASRSKTWFTWTSMVRAFEMFLVIENWHRPDPFEVPHDRFMEICWLVFYFELTKKIDFFCTNGLRWHQTHIRNF